MKDKTINTNKKKSNLSLKPIHPAPDFWYYEEPAGLRCYYGKHGRAGELVALIPWRMVRASLKRKDGQ